MTIKLNVLIFPLRALEFSYYNLNQQMHTVALKFTIII